MNDREALGRVAILAAHASESPAINSIEVQALHTVNNLIARIDEADKNERVRLNMVLDCFADAGVVLKSDGKAEYPIRKFLDISTGHLTEKTRKIMGDSEKGPCSYPTEYGWFCYADEQPEVTDYPDDLKAAMLAARTRGCDYIMFDCDAAECDFLPLYDDED